MPAGAPRRGESSESIIRGALRPLHPRAQPFILCLNIRPPHCARVVKLHYSFFILHYSLKKDSHTNKHAHMATSLGCGEAELSRPL